MASSTSYTEEVAAAVRSAIETAGTNSHALATATGIPRATLLRRLTGNSPFTVEELALIASQLGVHVYTLSSPKGEAA